MTSPGRHGRRACRVRRARRGAQALEFALALPILIALMAGMVDLAQYLLLADGVVASIGEASRAGAAAAEDEDPQQIASQVAQISWTNSGLPGTLTVQSSLEGSDPDRWIAVSGSVPYSAWFGFLGLPTAVTYTSTLRLVEQ